MYVINEKTKIVNKWADNEINQKRLESGKYGVVKYDGEVEQGDNGILYAKGYAPQKPLEELKAEKRAEINQARDNAEQGGFKYLGKTFDSDQVSCIRMSSAAHAMQYAPDEATITWTTQDNSTIDLNKSQLACLVVALAQHSNECHQKATALKAQIDAAETAEELDKITWEDKPAILL